MKLGWLLLGLAPLWAFAGDTKKEMLTLLDALCSGAPAAEAAVDWENLKFSGEDSEFRYLDLSSTQKDTFRKAFLTGFARSFQQKSGGRSFSAAEAKFHWRTEGVRPGCSGNGLKIEFHRQNGALKIVLLHL